jgi:hypothetical protein
MRRKVHGRGERKKEKGKRRKEKGKRKKRKKVH